MGKKMVAILLSFLMAAQTPVMAGEIMVEETPLMEEIATEEVLIEEELPEEVTIEENISEEIFSEEEILDNGFLEEPMEESLISEDTFEDEMEGETFDTITEEVPAEQIDAVPSEEEEIIEEDELSLVGESSGQCGDNVYWTLSADGTLTVSGTGDMWDFSSNDAPWFNDKSIIKNVVINHNVTSIGDKAFYNCTSITSVNISDSVTRIGEWAFESCSCLINICIPETITNLCAGTFARCSSLSSVTIPSSVTSIEDYAFEYCTNLKDIKLSNSLLTLGNAAFYYCTNLISIDIPAGVEKIGANAFDNCIRLENIILPSELQEIEYGVFRECSSLKQIEIPSNVETIGREAFISCKNLESIILPYGIQNIDIFSFESCISLKSINLPESIKRIGSYAFRYCSSLESIKIPCGIEFGEGIFMKCGNLKSASFSNGATIIGARMFKDCNALTDVILPISIEDISYEAFCNCSSLTSIHLPEHVNSIGSNAFSGCNFSSIEIPSSVTSISYELFADCSNLSNIYLPSSITNISVKAFMRCTSLENITIPDSVLYIDDDAFLSCSNLKKIKLSKNLKSLGKYTFQYCTSLQEIEIPDSVTVIDENAFDNCYSLKKVIIPKSIARINYRAFSDCNALEDVYYMGTEQDWNNISINAYNETLTKARFHYLTTPTIVIEDWHDWLRVNNYLLKYLTKPENFPHDIYITANDDGWVGRFSYYFTNFVDGTSGWRELLQEKTSKEEAEQILYSLLEAEDYAIDELATAKAAEEIISVITDNYQTFCETELYDVYILDNLKPFFSSNTFTELIREGKVCSITRDDLAGYVSETYRDQAKNALYDFMNSESLKKGLSVFGTGLEVLDVSQSYIDYMFKYVKLQQANDIYLEMLDYLSERAEYEVVRQAAGEIRERAEKNLYEAIAEINMKIADDKAPGIIINELLDKVWFLKAAQGGMQAGKLISNGIMHVWEDEELKNTMRVSADIGNTLSHWCMEKYASAMGTEINYKEAEASLYSIQLLIKTRITGESALRELSKRLWDNRTEKASISVLSLLNSYDAEVKALHEYNKSLLQVACPVEMEICNSQGTVLVRIPDNIETEGYENGIYYYSYFCETSDDYIKAAIIPDNSGYYFRAIANGAGTVSGSVTSIDSDGYASDRCFDNIPIYENDTVTVSPSNGSVIINKKGTEIKKQLYDKNAVNQISVEEIRKVTQDPLSIKIGEGVVLEYSVIPENADNQRINWSTSDPSIALVNKDGVVEGVSEGTAVITATTEDENKSIAYTIYVGLGGRTLFSDVTDPTAFFYEPIYWAVDNNITTGFPADNTFRPNKNCNRAAVVTFLWRLAGRPTPSTKATFTDMTDNHDFDTAISWAAEQGITTGYDDGTFRPWNTCNRAAIVTFLWRYAGRPEPSSVAKFKDMTKNDDFDRAISWAAEKGITTGWDDGTFRPWNQCLRLAVVTFLYRYAHL